MRRAPRARDTLGRRVGVHLPRTGVAAVGDGPGLGRPPLVGGGRRGVGRGRPRPRAAPARRPDGGAHARRPTPSWPPSSRAWWSSTRSSGSASPPPPAPATASASTRPWWPAARVSFADGVHLVVARGEAMARAGEDAPGTMAALLGIVRRRRRGGLPAGRGRRLGGQLQRARARWWSPATSEAVATVSVIARELGARKVMPIPVSGAFHTPLMAGGPVRTAQGARRRGLPGPRGPGRRQRRRPGPRRPDRVAGSALGPAVQPGPLAPDARDAGRPRRDRRWSSSAPAAC